MTVKDKEPSATVGKSAPHKATQTLRSSSEAGKAPSVLLFLESSREFGRGLLHGIARYSRLHGPWRVYRRSAGLESTLPEWRDLKIDGAIVRDVKMVRNLTGSGFPIIFAQHTKATTPPFPAIITDSAAIGHMAAEHFLDRGFVHFAYCGFDEFIWSRLRAQHFAERIGREGFQMSLYQCPRRIADRAWKSEQHLIADWLVSLPKPVAMMCCNDDRALQVIEACKLAEVYVPDHVAVLGVDDDVLICDLADPPISSVALNTEAAGHEAAKLLDELMNGGRMSGQYVWVRPTHIVTRLSTDILAVTDVAVATALRFIRLNTHRVVQVDDVVEAANVSRRVLEKRFKAILRRSIHQEIRRVRVGHIIRLLVETNMRIREIAAKSGFDGVEHISRYFHRETGLSLREYRKQHAVR
jgi:LacI family transcriptional regulator